MASAAPRRLGLLGRMGLRKSVTQIQHETATSELKRSLGPWNLVFLGIGASSVIAWLLLLNPAGEAVHELCTRMRVERLRLVLKTVARTDIADRDHDGQRTRVTVESSAG